MLWGQNPAMVLQSANVVRGMAYEVYKVSHMEYLKFYETEAYKPVGCKISLADGRGETSVYNDEVDMLKEGNFDLRH